LENEADERALQTPDALMMRLMFDIFGYIMVLAKLSLKNNEILVILKLTLRANHFIDDNHSQIKMKECFMPQFKESPNPLTLSIQLDDAVLKTLDHFDVSRKTMDDAKFMPLAKAFMKHEGILSVLIARDLDGNDYVSIRKDHQSWNDDEKQWALDVVKYFVDGQHSMIFEAAIVQAGKQAELFQPKTMSEKIVSGIFNQVMLPIVKRDGGSFLIHQVVPNEDGASVDVHISLQGACDGCPSARKATLGVTKIQLKRAFRELAEQNGGVKFNQIVVFDPSDLKTPQFTV
jgi:Fe-S cluster biogenesis protein NfuA